MATNVADLVATLRMDSGQFTRGVQQASGQAQTLTQRFSSLGTALKGALGSIAAKQVLDFGVAMFKVGMQSEAFGRKYRAVFGENTRELDTWVDAHHESFGVATDEVQGYLAQIGNLLTGMGQTADEAGKQATKILELAGAWSAWSGGQISVQDASDKLVKGMMGQTRGLIELGLKVTEQEVAARMAAEGLDELTGAEASRAQQQVMWTLIQEKSTTAVGAYDEALGGAYGAAMSMSTAVDELKDKIGEMVVKLAPAISGLADLIGLGTDALAILTFSYKPNYEKPGQAEMEAAARPVMVAAVKDFIAGLGRFTRVLRPIGVPIQITPTAVGVPDLPLSFIWEQQVDTIDEEIERLSGLVTGRVPNLFHRAFLEARREVDKGFGLISRGFTEFVLPDISLDEFMDNMADWQEAQDNVDAMLAALGEHGLLSFATALAEGLSPEYLAWIAGVWGGDLKALYAALPAYGPGGTKHPGSSNPPIEGQAAGGPVSAMTPYVVGERGPELFVPRSAGTIIPNGQYGSSSGGGFSGSVGGSTVNIGMIIGDDETVAETVSTALRRAKQRGG